MQQSPNQLGPKTARRVCNCRRPLHTRVPETTGTSCSHHSLRHSVCALHLREGSQHGSARETCQRCAPSLVDYSSCMESAEALGVIPKDPPGLLRWDTHIQTPLPSSWRGPKKDLCALLLLVAFHEIVPCRSEGRANAVAAALEEIQRQVGLKLPPAVHQIQVQRARLESAEVQQCALPALVRRVDGE